jgi:hypothetical protein
LTGQGLYFLFCHHCEYPSKSRSDISVSASQQQSLKWLPHFTSTERTELNKTCDVAVRHSVKPFAGSALLSYKGIQYATMEGFDVQLYLIFDLRRWIQYKYSTGLCIVL